MLDGAKPSMSKKEIRNCMNMCECIRKKFHENCSDNIKHYCVIMPASRNNINTPSEMVAFGTNYNEQYKNMYSRHAEMDALSKVNKLINIPKKVNLLVIKLTLDGSMSYSRPCYFCLFYLARSNFNIKYVYYSNRSGGISKELFNDMINSPLTYISSGERSRRNKNKFQLVMNKISYHTGNKNNKKII